MNLEELKKETEHRWSEKLAHWNKQWSDFIIKDIEEGENRLFYLIEFSEEMILFLKGLSILYVNWDSGGHDDEEEFYITVRYKQNKYKIIGTFFESDEEGDEEFYDVYKIDKIYVNEDKDNAFLDDKVLTETNIGLSEVFSRFGMKECILSLSNMAEEFNDQLLNYYENKEI